MPPLLPYRKCASALSYFEKDAEAKGIVEPYFEVLINEFIAPAPSDKVRQRNSTDLQGLQLPQIYFNAAERRPKFVMKPGLSVCREKRSGKAAYRQIF